MIVSDGGRNLLIAPNTRTWTLSEHKKLNGFFNEEDALLPFITHQESSVWLWEEKKRMKRRGYEQRKQKRQLKADEEWRESALCRGMLLFSLGGGKFFNWFMVDWNHIH